MRIDIITLFPEMCEAVLSESIIGRAVKKGAVEIVYHQLRDFAFDKHRRVDDTPYGGGMGLHSALRLCVMNSDLNLTLYICHLRERFLIKAV